jgi:hypothetical protein
MKTYGGVDVQIYALVTSTFVGEWSASSLGRFTPWGRRPRYPLVRRLGRAHSRSGRRGGEKFLPLPGLELRPLGRPDRSQSLYRLSYFVEDLPPIYDQIFQLFYSLQVFQ